MCSYDSTLCLIDWTANPMVHVYNMNTGKEMVAFGNKGMGPDDFLSISQMYVDMGKRSLVLYDQSLQTISSFQIDLTSHLTKYAKLPDKYSINATASQGELTK